LTKTNEEIVTFLIGDIAELIETRGNSLLMTLMVSMTTFQELSKEARLS
jgi:hypothetical protein